MGAAGKEAGQQEQPAAASSQQAGCLVTEVPGKRGCSGDQLRGHAWCGGGIARVRHVAAAISWRRVGGGLHVAAPRRGSGAVVIRGRRGRAIERVPCRLLLLLLRINAICLLLPSGCRNL